MGKKSNRNQRRTRRKRQKTNRNLIWIGPVAIVAGLPLLANFTQTT